MRTVLFITVGRILWHVHIDNEASCSAAKKKLGPTFNSMGALESGPYIVPVTRMLAKARSDLTTKYSSWKWKYAIERCTCCYYVSPCQNADRVVSTPNSKPVRVLRCIFARDQIDPQAFACPRMWEPTKTKSARSYQHVTVKNMNRVYIFTGLFTHSPMHSSIRCNSARCRLGLDHDARRNTVPAKAVYSGSTTPLPRSTKSAYHQGRGLWLVNGRRNPFPLLRQKCLFPWQRNSASFWEHVFTSRGCVRRNYSPLDVSYCDYCDVFSPLDVFSPVIIQAI